MRHQLYYNFCCVFGMSWWLLTPLDSAQKLSIVVLCSGNRSWQFLFDLKSQFHLYSMIYFCSRKWIWFYSWFREGEYFSKTEIFLFRPTTCTRCPTGFYSLIVKIPRVSFYVWARTDFVNLTKFPTCHVTIFKHIRI